MKNLLKVSILLLSVCVLACGTKKITQCSQLHIVKRPLIKVDTEADLQQSFIDVLAYAEQLEIIVDYYKACFQDFEK